MIENWTSLTYDSKLKFIFSALVKSWKELGSAESEEFKLKDGTILVNSKGVYLVLLRDTGSIFFTLTLTHSENGSVQVTLTPHRYRHPDFKNSVVLDLVEPTDYENFVSLLDKKQVDALVMNCGTALFKEIQYWNNVYTTHLSNEVSDYLDEIQTNQRQNRNIEDVELELSFAFARLTRLYVNWLGDSKEGELDGKNKVADTEFSSLLISNERLVFQTKFNEVSSYTFELRPQGIGYGHLGYFSLADDKKYLTTFGVYLGDFKEGSVLASSISKEHQLLFLQELELCIVSLGLWGEYYRPSQSL